MSRHPLFLLTLVLALCCGVSAVEGQAYVFSTTSGEGSPGDTVTVTVSLRIDDGATGVRSLQFAQCFDDSVVSITAPDITELSYLGDLNGGAGPGFGSVSVATDSWNAGIIVDLMDDTDVLTDSGDLYEATYSLDAAGSTGLEFCGDGLFPEVVQVVVGGVDTAAGVEDGQICVAGTTGYELSLDAPACAIDGDSIDVDVNVKDLGDSGNETNAFALSIAHDGAILTATGAVEAGPLLGLGGGAGAGFFTTDVTPDNGDGVTVGCVYNLSDPTDTLIYDSTGSTIVTISYDATVAADGQVALLFDDSLSDVVQNEVIVTATAETPSTCGAIVLVRVDSEDCDQIVCSAADFRRGDADGNGVVFAILDALFLLEFGFTNGPSPPCDRAADADGNGVVFPILDALFLLEFGFTNGPPPPDPGPTVCGPGPNGCAEGLSCFTPPSC